MLLIKKLSNGTYNLFGTGTDDFNFRVLDQYSVNVASTDAVIIAGDAFVFDNNTYGFFASSDNAKLSVDTTATPNTVTVNGTAGDVLTLNYITNAGLSASIKITVK